MALRRGLLAVPGRFPAWLAGLAAAALAHMLENPFLSGFLQTFLSAAVAITAIGLFIPVTVSGLLFLVSSCRFCAKASWPPTFSTAVCALGCLQAAEVLHSIALHRLGLATGAVTLLFWAITAGWNSIFHQLQIQPSA